MRPFSKSRLSTTIFIYLFTIAIIPLLIIAFFSYNAFSRALEMRIKNTLMSMANGRLALIEERLTSISEFVTERSSGPTPVTACEQLQEAYKNAGADSEEYKLLEARFYDIFRKYFNVYSYLHDMLLVSQDGDVIFSINNKDMVGQNIHGDLLKGSNLTGLIDSVNTYLSTAVSEFDYFSPSGKPALFIAAPIFGTNRLLGTLVFHARPELLYELAKDLTGLPETGEIVFAKLSGDDIIYTTPLRLHPNAALNFKIKKGSDIAMPLQKALNGDTGIGLGVDYRGRNVLARWQYIPQLRWGMVVKVDKDEVFKPIYNLGALYIITFYMLVIIIVAASFTLSSRLSRPIEALRDGIKIIGGGDLDHKIDIKRADEIGELSDDINRMARNLKFVTASRDELTKIKGELERSNKDLEQFAYIASHDLQEPLRMIVSYTQLLEKNYQNQLDEKGGQFVKYTSDGAKRMQDFISALLQYSRIGKDIKPFDKVDMNSVCDRAIKNMEAAIHDNKALVTRDNLPEVMGDEMWLTHLLQNLIANGVKFRREENPSVHVSAREDMDEWVFAVSDNGIGIDMQFKDRLFVIFQRLHTRDKYPGTGIGLAVCKKIVDIHGGRIWLESEINKGTKIFFAIPKSRKKKLGGYDGA